MNKLSILAEKTVETKKLNSGLLISILLFLGLGLVTLCFSSMSAGFRIKEDQFYFIKRQLIYCLIGLCLMMVSIFFNLSLLKKILPLIFIAVLLLSFLTVIPGIGVEAKGARRWMSVPVIGRFQPSEFAKLTIILFLANLFSKKQKEEENPNFPVLRAFIGLFLFVFAIIMQDDFSTAFFILMLGLIIFFVAKIQIHWFVSFILMCIPFVFLFIFTEPYRITRLITFFNRSYDLHGSNYQINAACRAISSAGFWGRGIGAGLQRVSGIPEVQADFVFAGWVEAMGFLGVLIYFTLLIYFAWQGYSASIKCVDKFNGLASFGMMTSLVFQSVMNCGVVCGALPSTGIPLPFFSSGGSSLIVTLIMCGLLINIFREDNKSKMEIVYE